MDLDDLIACEREVNRDFKKESTWGAVVLPLGEAGSRILAEDRMFKQAWSQAWSGLYFADYQAKSAAQSSSLSLLKIISNWQDKDLTPNFSW